MKNLILFFSILIFGFTAQSQKSIYNIIPLDTITNTSYGSTPDSTWLHITLTKTTDPNVLTYKHYWQCLIKADSISGGFGDSARIVVQVRGIPYDGSSTTSVNKYNSVVLATHNFSQGVTASWNSCTDTVNECYNDIAMREYYILIYSFPGVISTQYQGGFTMSGKPN